MAIPNTLEDFRARLGTMPAADLQAVAAAQARDAVLTKPPGALGRLEEIVLWLAAWQGRAVPQLDHPQVVVFAGNHGIAAQGVSAFPPAVTRQMVANFKAGGAAVNQLARAYGAQMSVVELQLDQPTADFTLAPAMTEPELCAAMRAGWQAVDPAADLFIPGEMGIGNTTVAAAMAAALFGGSGWAGRGTGVDSEGLARKEAAVVAALACHAGQLDDPFELMRRLGGREVAAMAGAILAARHHRVPVLLDGFIASAAAAVLWRGHPDALAHVMAAHLSNEGAHGRLLAALGKRPLLALDLRLGEASGAALALGIVKGAVACHAGMASFAEAGVSAS